MSTVTLDPQGGSGGTRYVFVDNGSAMPSASAPTKKGYTFTGYYGPLGVSAQKYYNANMSSARNWNYNDDRTLTAGWEPNEYTATLNKQGGSGGTSSVTVRYDMKMPVANAPSKDGYNFKGYADTESGGAFYYDADMDSSHKWDKPSNGTIYALWEKKTYTVTLNRSGGTGGTSSVKASYSDAMPSMTLPTREGYTFAGYYDIGNTKYYNANGSSAKNWDKTSNTTLYAQWTVNTYAVTLDRCGGSGGSTSVNVTYQSAMPSASAPSKSGYSFGGYFSETGGKGKKYYNADMSSAAVWSKASTGKLYAYWTANSYTITFNKQSGSGGTSTATAVFGRAVPEATAPTREGYTFAGYYDADSEGTKYYNSDMSNAKNWDKSSNTTLYARWTARSYTVTLNKQSGSGGTSTVSVKYGNAMPSVTPPTRTGCTFTGYYDEKKEGTKYYNANGTSAKTWDKAKSTTLFAYWTANQYTVTLNRRGGSSGSTSVTATYGSAMPSASAPSKTGYNFTGYYDKATGGTKYYNADMTSARTWTKAAAATLYAHWSNAIIQKSGTTKKATGLSISREGRKFTFTWKIGDDDYATGLEIQWRTNLTASGKWAATVKPAVRTGTDYTITLPAADYYPITGRKLTMVSFRVRGKRSQKTVERETAQGTVQDVYTYGWSEWVQKNFTVNIPNLPTITQELDADLNNVSKFTWETTTNDDDSRPFYNAQWQSILVRASKVTDGSALTWSSNNSGWKNGAASGTPYSVTITEESELLAADSYTRWVRVRSRGSAGYTAWRYTKHVYARPNKPTIESVTSSVSSGVTTVKVTWTATTDAAHPIDYTTVQYCMTVPASGRAVPTDASWTDAAVFRDTAGKDAGQFTIEGAPGTDQVLFVRVVVTHDRNDVYSAAKLVRQGTMYAPDIDSVETVDSTRRATVEAVNNSEVPDSRLAVIYRDSDKNTKDICIGIIANGDTSVSALCPEWTGKTPISFGVYAFQGTYTSSKRSSDSVTVYTVTANWKSATVWKGGAVPVAPSSVSAAKTDLEGEVLVKWAWSWAAANQAEISWSNNPNAWESTATPSTFIVDHLQAAHWRVSGLSLGSVWYFRVRLARESGGDYNWGPYSSAVSVDMTSAPEKPILTVSKDIIRLGNKFTASWTYESTDGTAQAVAEIRSATVSGSTVTIGSLLAKVTTAKRVTINSSNWALGSTHYLVARVTSTTGNASEWSDPVSVSVANAVTCTITSTNLEVKEIEGSDGVVRNRTCMVELPLNVTVTGANDGGRTTVILERYEDYQIERPDGKEARGYAGETAAIVSIDGPGTVTVTKDDLIMQLDDGAMYRIVAIAEDKFGQTATKRKTFTVMWDHQALDPEAQVEIDDSGAAHIQTSIPEDADEEDTYSIYRLSVDLPELIVENGELGDEFVDPFPVFGEAGGYRVVYVSKYGDYIKEDSQPAWADITRNEWGWTSDSAEQAGDLLAQYTVIDFDGEQILLDCNLVVDNAWEKDFKTTTYLGGSVQGDWNPGVQRQGSVGTVVLTENVELVQALRRLAVYTGICHVRTPDGSSYSANIDVTETQSYEKAGKIAEIALNITRVDPDVLDGMTLDEWVTEQEGS